MAYSDNYPAQRPVFSLDAANAGRLDPRMTFSRSDTPPTYAAPSAVHYWSNEKHLSSENLIANSEALTGTGYIAVNVTPTTGQADPTGGTNAVQFEQDSGQTTSGYVLVENQPSSGQFTYSFHAKANGKNWIVIQEVFTDSSLNETWFSISGAGGAGTTNANHTNVTVTKLGDWYRCSWTMTSTRVGYLRIGVADSDGSTTVTDSGGVYLYGVQRNTGGSLLDYQSTSGQIHREYAPTLKSVSTAGQPRFEYDPSSDGQSAAKGILIEGQATNLLTYSSNFANSSWVKIQTNIEAAAAIAPDGTLSASYLRAAADSSGGMNLFSSATITNNATVNGSVYIKKTGTDSHCAILIYNGGNQARQWFDLINKTTSTSYSVGSGFSVVNAGVEDVGNGWMRINVSASCTGTTAYIGIYPSVSSDGAFASTVASSNALLYGAQLTESSYPSSLISTSGSTATRAAESLSVDLSALGIGNEVTAVGEAISTAVTSNRETVIQLSPSGSNDVALYAGRNVGGGVSSQFYAGGGAVYLGGGSVTAGSAYKFAAREAPANHALCLNGGTVATNTSAVDSTTIGTLHIGSRSDGSNNIYGHCKRIAIYNEALSDSNLQAITS